MIITDKEHKIINELIVKTINEFHCGLNNEGLSLFHLVNANLALCNSLCGAAAQAIVTFAASNPESEESEILLKRLTASFDSMITYIEALCEDNPDGQSK